MKFASDGDDACHVEDVPEAQFTAANLLGVPADGDESLDKMLCIKRQNMMGGKLDARVNASGASDNRNALIKDL